MFALVHNCRSVQPFAEEISIQMPVYNLPSVRNAFVSTYVATGETSFNLGWTPIHKDWVEVYVDGFRIVNQSTDFGVTNDKYEVAGTSITFYEPVHGTLQVICDKNTCPPYDDIQVISIINEQGAIVRSKLPDGSYYAALFCEPIALMQPVHGYVRQSDDRKSLVYYPEQGYNGGDAFSYLVRTERGQLSTPKCVYIFVGDKPVEEGGTP